MFLDIQQTQFENLPLCWQINNIDNLTGAANSYKNEKTTVRNRNTFQKEANKPAVKKENKADLPPPQTVEAHPDAPKAIPIDITNWIEKNKIYEANKRVYCCEESLK